MEWFLVVILYSICAEVSLEANGFRYVERIIFGLRLVYMKPEVWNGFRFRFRMVCIKTVGMENLL